LTKEVLADGGHIDPCISNLNIVAWSLRLTNWDLNSLLWRLALPFLLLLCTIESFRKLNLTFALLWLQNREGLALNESSSTLES
jgi:hypothetical protein